jgi:4-amino-4-deoxy-L-arabinose transferase-like glycosyltransferase
MSWRQGLARLREARGFLGGCAAVALALAGQRALLLEIPNARRAVVAYGLAFAVLLVSARDVRRATTPKVLGRESPARRNWRAVFWIGLAVSVGLGASAALVLWKGKSPQQTLPAVLWALSLLLMVLAWRWRGRRAGAAPILAGPEDDPLAPGEPQPTTTLEICLVAGMLLLGAFLRVFQLGGVPGIFGDEGELGMDARAILEGSRAPFFGFGWGGIANPAYYGMAAMLRLFGDGIVGLRMFAALGGVVTVFLLYRTGRLLWGPRAGLLAGTLFAIQPVALQFGRFATTSGLTGTLWAAAFFFLARALRLGGPADASLAGIFFGLSMYFYPSGRLVLLLLPAIVAYLVLVRWRRLRDLAPALAALLLAFFMTIPPYAVSSLKDGWEAFTARYQQRAIFAPPNRPEAFSGAGLRYDEAWREESLPRSFARHPAEWGRVLFHQLRTSVEVLYVRADATLFYNIRDHRGSMLSPLLAALTLLGLAYATARVFRPEFGLLSLWFWGGLLGTALTLDTPSVQRMTGAWPSVMFFPAVLLDRIAASSWPVSVPLARRWLNVPLAALLAAVGLEGYREYFVHYRSIGTFDEATLQARYAQSLGTAYKAYHLGVGDGVTAGDYYFDHGSTRFVARGVEGSDVWALSEVLPVTDEPKKGVAFLVRPSNTDYLPILRSIYPGGQEELLRTPDGLPRFTAYKLSSSQVAAVHTLRATYTQPDGRSIERDEPGLGKTPGWSPPPGLSYPARASWSGSLVAPSYGGYRFRLYAPPGSSLSVDEFAAAETLDVLLARGLHDVRLTTVLSGPEDPLSVTWAFQVTGDQPITRRYLFHRGLGGLLGEIWTDSPAHLPSLPETPPSSRRVDPAIGLREARRDTSIDQRPFVARWSGLLKAESSGRYLFEVGARGLSTLRVDGRDVLSARTGAPSYGAVELQSGSHAIELLYECERGQARLDLYWTPPSGPREIVPPAAWSPSRRSWLPD